MTSVKELAARLKVSPSTAYYHIRKAGVAPTIIGTGSRNRPTGFLNDEQVEAVKVSILTPQARGKNRSERGTKWLAEKLDVSERQVRYAVIKLGMELPGSGSYFEFTNEQVDALTDYLQTCSRCGRKEPDIDAV